MSTRTFSFLLAAVLVLGMSANSFAQATPAQPAPAKPAQPAPAAPATTTNAPTFELSAGYQFLHVPDQTFPFGLNVDAARYFGSLGVVGEVGWAYDSESTTFGDASAHAWNFGVGPRWTGFGSGRAWPFVQVIVGAEVLHASFDVAGVSVSDTTTAFMVQPGAGVTFVAGDGWGIFGQVDYRRTFFDDADVGDDDFNNQFRVVVGARMILD